MFKESSSKSPPLSNENLVQALRFPAHPYHSLACALAAAFEQAAAGKGAKRHAQSQPFPEQPMQSISALIGSSDGMAYQVIKKVQEAQRLPPEARRAELLGAIVYTAGMLVRDAGDPQ